MSDHPNDRFGIGRWHCDDFLANEGTMRCVRDFLEIARAPAARKTRPYPKLFASLSHDVTMREYLGYWEGSQPKMRERSLPAGERVRVVMASRFGDVGVTDKLDAEHGYGARLFLPELYDFGNAP